MQCPKCDKVVDQTKFMLHDSKCRVPPKRDSIPVSEKSLIQSNELQDDLAILNSSSATKRPFNQSDRCPSNNKSQTAFCQYCQNSYTPSYLKYHLGVCQKRIEASSKSESQSVQSSIVSSMDPKQQSSQSVSSEPSKSSSSQQSEPFSIQQSLIEPVVEQPEVQEISNNQVSNAQLVGETYLFNASDIYFRIARFMSYINQMDIRSTTVFDFRQLVLRIPLLSYPELIFMSIVDEGSNLEDQGITKQQFQSIKKIKYRSEEKQACSICQIDFEKNQSLLQLHCKHKYHGICLQPWFEQSSKCPVCKADVRDRL